MTVIKKLPASLELEELVLGALLIDSEAIHDVMSLVADPDIFSDEKNICVFKAIQWLFDDGTKVDIITVAERLKMTGQLAFVGTEIYLIQLTQKVASSAHLESHIRVLQQFYIKRKIILESEKMKARAYDEGSDVFTVLDEWGDVFTQINENVLTGKKQITFSEALDQLEVDIERLTNSNGDEIIGVPTGLKKLDSLIGGWRSTDLIVLAARPGMGKTSFIARSVLANGTKKIPVGIVSLEMSTKQLTTRLVANNSEFHLTQLFRKGFEKPEYFQTFRNLKEAMKEYPLYFNDTPSQDIKDVMTQCRLWKKKHDVQVIFIDYLQLISDKTKKHSREQEIASITSSLKALAKELDVPVIVLSQLSRKVEDRGGDKRPKLSDLRESGAIEQDADIIGFLWRPEYYKMDVPDELLAMNANTLLDIQKHRNGSLAELGLWFVGDKTKFLDPSVESVEPNNDMSVAF